MHFKSLFQISERGGSKEYEFVLQGKEAKVLHKIVFFRFAADAYKCQQQSEKVSFMRTCTETVVNAVPRMKMIKTFY